MARARLCMAAAATALGLALAPTPAGAAEQAGGADPASRAAKAGGGETAGAGKQASRTTTGQRKVLRLEALTVEGKLQKPEAFYILQRANPEFDDLGRPESFLPKVIESERDGIF